MINNYLKHSYFKQAKQQKREEFVYAIFSNALSASIFILSAILFAACIYGLIF